MDVIFSPTQSTERIGVLDFLRGIAVLGILIINIESFCYPDPWSPFEYGFKHEHDHDVRFWAYFFAQGKFFSMFTLLFGVGFYVFLERLEKKGIGLRAMDIYARRLLWLFIFGVLHAYLIWDGDVLFHYAVCGFLLAPFRSFSIRQLSLTLLIPVGVLLYLAYENTAFIEKQFQEYTQAQAKPSEVRTGEDVKAIQTWNDKTAQGHAHTSPVEVPRKTIIESWEVNAEHVKVHKGNILHTGIFFRTFIMMILGILLYKKNVFRDYRSIRAYWFITFSILLLAITMNWFRYNHWTFAYMDPVRNVWWGWLFTFPKELMGLAYILLFNGVYQKYFLNFTFRPVSLCGKMAFSNYIFQSCICAFIFYGFGLGYYNQFSRSELLFVVVGIWSLQVIFSFFWLKKFNQGPLEGIWRKLTYNGFTQAK